MRTIAIKGEVVPVALDARRSGCGGTVLSSDKDKQTPDRKSPAKVHSKDRDMGSALRSAYQKTVDESVPDEMLDLLSKLS